MPLCRIMIKATLLGCISLHAMTPGATHNSTLTGALQGDDERPIQGHIMAYHIDARHGRMMPSPECSTDTDPQGNFQCVHLEPGSYILVASALRHVSATSLNPSKMTAQDSLPLFVTYPVNTYLDITNVVHLASGETQLLEIPVHSDSGSDLHVKSAGASRNDKALQVYLLGEDFTVSTNVRIEANPDSGNYDIKGLPPGTYRLTELWSDDGITHQGAAYISTGPLGAEQASITEIKPYTVSGAIRYPDSMAHGAVEVVLESAATFDPHRYTAIAQTNGKFSIPGVLSGSYYISLNPDSGLYAADTLLSDHSTGGAAIKVDDGLWRTSLTLVASSASGSIAGTLELDDNERKGAGIVVESIASHTSEMVPVDAQGRFKVNKLAPGEYLLYGWADVGEMAYDSSSFLRRYKNKGVRIDLDNGALASDLEIECNRVGP